eukprot:Lankesteria_metandrocarpae@DN1739_c0_g1_i1.p1
MSSDPQHSSKLQFVLDSVNVGNYGTMVKLNSVCLPITLPPTYKQDVLRNTEYAQFAHVNNVPIGGITCRVETTPCGEDKPTATTGSSTKQLYIMTLCVLPSFRRYGIGTDLLRWVLSKAASNATLDEVYLHVWKGNPAAVQIYKGEGFEEVGEEELYKYLKPATAVRMRKLLL